MAQPNSIQQASPTLNTKEITDSYVKDNFRNLNDYFAKQNQLKDFRFFDLSFTAATANFLLSHGFSYVPQDILITKLTGGGTVVFNYGLFTTSNINMTVTGACRVRFFVGTYWNYITTTNDPPNVYTAHAALPSAAVVSTTAQVPVTNPMTTPGDMIYGGAAGLPTRLAGGSAGANLTSVGPLLPPVWAVPGSSGAGAGVPAGMIMAFGGSVAPAGYLVCDGTSYSRATYALLFQAIGTTWGGANSTGLTTFNVPNLGGVFIRGHSGVFNTRDDDAATRTAAISGTFTVGGGVTVNNSTQVTVSSTAELVPGMVLTGTGIPASTVVRSIVDSTTFILGNLANSAGVTATASNSGLTFTFNKAPSGCYAGSAQVTSVGPHTHGLLGGAGGSTLPLTQSGTTSISGISSTGVAYSTLLPSGNAPIGPAVLTGALQSNPYNQSVLYCIRTGL